MRADTRGSVREETGRPGPGCSAAGLARRWTGWRVGGIAAALALAVGPRAAAGASGQNGIAQGPATGQARQGVATRLVTGDALAAGLERYLGQRVSITGRVVEAFGNRLFGVGIPQGAQTVTVPVLAVQPPRPAAGRTARSPVRVGDVVAAVGQVSRFTVNTERAGPQTALMASESWRFTSQPAVLAETLAVLNLNSSQNAAVDPGGLLVSAQGRSLIGRWVNLLGVTVESVVSDRGFWVTAADGSRIWVMLSPALDRGRMEGLVQIRQGQELDILGRLVRMPSAAQMRSAGWTVTAAEAAGLQGEPFYVRANSVRIHRDDE